MTIEAAPADLVAAAGGSSSNDIKGESFYLLLGTAMIEHPGANSFELAALLGADLKRKVSPRWVATIKNSDAFQEYFRKRHQVVIGGIQNKTAAVVELALDRIAERVELFGDVIPIDSLNDIADKGSKRLGFGSAAPMNLAVNVGVAVGRGDLEDARKRMQETFGVTAEGPAVAVPLIGSTSVPAPSPPEDKEKIHEGEILP